MVVYSKYNEAYKLSGKAAAKTADGSIYDVPADPGIQVKIFDKPYRTDAMERTVEDAITGMGMMDVTPIKTVYQNNRFAGFVMERAEAPMEPDPVITPDPNTDHIQPPPVQPPKADAGPIPLLVMIAAGLLMTALLIFLIYPSMASSMDSSVRIIHFNGIPLAACGWLLMLFVAVRSGGITWPYAIVGIVAFILGAGVCSVVIHILVYLFYGAKALLIALMPSIIIVVAIVAMLKGVIGGGR